MALNEQMQQMVQQDIKDAETRSKEEILQEQMEGLKTAGRTARDIAVESIPGVSESLAEKRIDEAMQRGDTTGAVIEGAAGLMGAVPMVGDAAAKGLRAVTKSFRKKDIGEAEKLVDNAEKLQEWRDANRLPESQRQKNIPEAQQAAEDLFQGNITSKESRKRIKEVFPEPQLYTAETMPEMPTITDVVGSMGKKAEKGILGVKGFDLEPGQRVGARLDIPAYNEYDKWVVSIHDGKIRNGSVVGYGQAIRLKNIEFGSDPEVALDIAKGKRVAKKSGEEKPMGKATIARVFGDYVPEDPYELQEFAKKVLADKDSGWTQVGMNPYRGSYFYNKETGKVVTRADEVIQVGPLVLAKNITEPKLSELKELFSQKTAKTKDGKIRVFNEGGVVPMKRMAEQMELFEPVERGFDEGGLMEEGGMVDEVSGNDVPPGSLRTEVRDDIPAQLSEGEFVFPADVVRYIGLENLMRMRQEAKQGLAQMEAMGQMGNSEEATIEDNLPFDMYDLDVDDEDEYNNMAVGGMPTKDQTRQAFQLGGTVQLPGFTGMQITQPTTPTTGYRPYVQPVQAASSQFVPQFTGVQYTTSTGTTNIPTFAETVGRNPGQYDELRTYVNDAGQTLQIPFKNGQPIYPIPYGYKYQAEEAVTPTDTTTVPTTVVGQDDDRGGDGNYGVGVGSATVTGASDMESAMMDASRGRFGTGVSSVGTYGGNREFGFSNPEMRSATFDMAKAQLGSLSPMAAAGIAIGNQLGILDNMSTPNQDAIAGQTAKGMALSAMGFSNPGQISTTEQATAYGLAISAAMEASKKGQDVRAAVNAVMEQNQNAVQQGQVSAMTDLGYNATDVSNQATVSRAVAGYNALAAAYDRDAQDALDAGTVTDSSGKAVTSEVTGKAVTTEKALQESKASKAKAEQAKAAAATLSNLEMNLDRSKSSGTPSFDASTGAPSDGFGPGTGGYSSEAAATGRDDAEQAGNDTGRGGSNSDSGTDSTGSTGVGTGTDCLTEDMKVKLNGIVDFVTNIKVGDMIDNYKVKEVLHKHMRSGYYAINNELKISNDHPVLANGTWTRPEDLVVGDNINGIPVTSLEYVERMTPTVSIVIDGESFDVHTENNIYTVHGRYKEVRQEAA